MHDALFTPVRLGAIEARNRILMAPLTRGRSDSRMIPDAMIAEYCRQRADAGLIISEATGITVERLMRRKPGIFRVPKGTSTILRVKR